MPWGIVIPSNESAPLEFRLFGQLVEYQETVGGYIESVALSDTATFYVNEMGKIESLPMNRRATLLWWAVSPAARNADVIAGDAIIIGQPDDEGDTQDVPGDLVTLLMKTEIYKYQVQTIDGGDKWHGNMTTFDNYFEACNAALGLLERWTLATDVRVLAA